MGVSGSGHEKTPSPEELRAWAEWGEAPAHRLEDDQAMTLLGLMQGAML
jgi:hypothetical protein